MYRGTTPIHIFDLPVETDQIKNLRATYVQRKEKIVEKRLTDVNLIDKKAEVRLSQRETLKFDASVPAYVQIRILTTDNQVFTSEPEAIDVKETFNEEILS